MDDRSTSPEAELDNSQLDKIYDKRDRWTTYVYSDVHTEIEWENMLQKLCPTYEEINGLAPEAPKMEKTEPGSGKSTYCDYLNKLSISVRTDAPYLVEFRLKHNQPVLDHPTGTKCRPDIVAVTQFPGIALGRLHWSHVDATGVEQSSKAPEDRREAQEGAYTSYHLQARPDLVSVPGILVSESYFKLFFSNARRVYHTGAIDWNSDEGQELLYAWMWRLYHPESDKSVTVDMKTSPPTFTVVAGGTAYNQLVVLRAGESIGRRTMVFERLNTNTILRRSTSLEEGTNLSVDESHDSQSCSSSSIDRSNIVIKEQYIGTSPSFREGSILKKIHAAGDFPGVVRLDHYEYVKNDGEDISVGSKLVKVRLVMKDRGPRLADVGTMRELLMGIYDLLEISRILFRKRKILHRDISPGNVLFNHKPANLLNLCGDLDDMCFSEYLLKDPAGPADSESESDRLCRLTTRIVLIDFDCAEDEASRHSTDRVGTTTFMARMVRSEQYPSGIFHLPPLPAVADKHLGRYPEARIKSFPTIKAEEIEIARRTHAPTRFKHLLRYDAESVFWYLLWCCVQAQPAGFPQDNNISPNVWSNLTYHGPAGQDGRDAHFITKFPEDFLHTTYRDLEPLLESMSMHLYGDLSYAEDERRNKDEYLHEVFQRLILNFLSTNATKPFMHIQKHKMARGVSRNESSTPPAYSTRPWSSSRPYGERPVEEHPRVPVSSSEEQSESTEQSSTEHSSL